MCVYTRVPVPVYVCIYAYDQVCVHVADKIQPLTEFISRVLSTSGAITHFFFLESDTYPEAAKETRVAAQ